MASFLQSVEVYDEKNNRKVSRGELERFLCPICKMYLNNPIQITHCGHRCCRACVKDATSLKTCPVDDEILEETQLKEDKGCQREMNSLKANCSTCGFVDTLSNIQAHWYNCQETVNCDYCQAKIKRTEIATHLDETCTEYLMSCPWKENGCTFESKRLPMTEHINRYHSIQQLELLMQLKAQVIMLSEKLICLGVPTGLENSTCQQSQQALQQLSAAVAPADTHLEPTSVLDSCDEDLKSRKKEGKEASALRTTHLDLQGLQERFSNQFSELKTKLDEISNASERHDVNIKELSLKCEILQVRTTNGVFIWRVNDIKRRYKDAKDSITYSLFSPPFLTSPHGYRMCLRMYLNGDGEGKGTHVSLFLVLMKGEHDSILPWPFSQKVTLSLIHQKNPNLTKQEAFLPDKSSSSFQKPQQEFNVAIGFPKFVLQSYINDSGFCQDDCFYVKAKVDCTGMNLD